MSEDSKLDLKLLKSLSNPIRQRILVFIDELGGATYTDLTEELELKSGPLYYHLRQMKQFVFQADDKKYLLTDDGKNALILIQGKKEPDYEIYEIPEKPRVFSIWRFNLAPFIRFFAKNPTHALIEFVILAGVSVFIGAGNKILIVGNFVLSYEVPIWLAYVSLIASWIVIAGFAELLSRFVYKRKKNSFALINVTNLIFLPSFLFILIIGVAGWISGVTLVVPSIVLLILHGLFQIWSFLIIITAVGELKELSIEKSALIAMIVSYTQIFTLIFVLV